MPIDPPDWSIWSKADVVELHEAISLSAGMSPPALQQGHKVRGKFDFLNEDEKADLNKRVVLSRSHLGMKLKVVGEVISGPKMVETKVHLTDFADFSVEMGWSLPPQFPRAPKPVTADAFGCGLDPVNWRVWRHKVEAELWQVVAVSLDVAPDDFILDSARDAFPDQFKTRLRDSVSLLGDKLPVASIAVWPEPRDNREFAALQMAGPPPAEMNTVYLTAFAEFAAEMRWNLPDQFPGFVVAKATVARVAVGPLIPNVTRPKPDWEHWSSLPHVEVWAAVALACDIAPELSMLNDPGSDDLVQFCKRLPIAIAHIEAGTLKHQRGYNKFVDLTHASDHVHLDEFAGWAAALPFPWDLPKVFPRPQTPSADAPKPSEAKDGHQPEPPAEEKAIRPRERTTLLVIIAALAKGAKIDVRETWKAAQSIEKLTVEMGARVSPEAISKKLREIPDALERAGKLGADQE
jgi:hypothetical protein